MTHEQTIIAEWITPEFTYQPKKVDWFWGLGIVVIVGIVLAVISKNFLLGVLVLLGGGLLSFYARKKPDLISVEMSDVGIKVNNSFYPYNNIKSFWIGANSHGEPILFLDVNRVVTPLMIIPIHPEMNTQELRELFLDYLPEVEHAEPFGHRISDRLGF